MPEQNTLASHFFTVYSSTWVISIILGALIGNAKGRVVSSLMWCFFFGIIGVIIVLFLPDLKKQKATDDMKLQLALQIRLQQEHSRKLDTIQRSAGIEIEPMLKIKSNEKEFGDIPITSVKLMLKNGMLSSQDFYFDTFSNDWINLYNCPQLIATPV